MILSMCLKKEAVEYALFRVLDLSHYYIDKRSCKTSNAKMDSGTNFPEYLICLCQFLFQHHHSPVMLTRFSQLISKNILQNVSQENSLFGRLSSRTSFCVANSNSRIDLIEISLFTVTNSLNIS